MLKGRWKDIVEREKKKDYMLELKSFLILGDMDKKQVFPPFKDVFQALEVCSFEDTKVVIVGQDPYHGYGQAHGMSFSVQPGVRIPPSLQNIYKELEDDVQIKFPDSGYLMPWANQGVLLLNNVLSVESGKAGSHRNKGWESFTNVIVDELNKHRDNLIFLLWGRDAQTKCQNVDKLKHLVLTAVHPSPLSCYRGFFGCKHFSKTNAYLKEHGKEEIDWQI